MKEAEEQLNKDLALRNLVAVNVKAFVDTAKQTSTNLTKRYGRQWTNPNTELAPVSQVGEETLSQPDVTADIKSELNLKSTESTTDDMKQA